MPRKVCKGCELDYPFKSEFDRCPVCNRDTKNDIRSKASADWEEKLNTALGEVKEAGDEEQRMVGNRIQRLRDLGYPWEDAAKLGAAYAGSGLPPVDVHRIEEHVRRGATLEQAAILES